MTPTRPILRYHGGKWLLAPWIIAHFPPHRVYIEPFGGAASVLIRKPPAPIEVYNDLNGELVVLFKVLRDKHMADELIYQIQMSPWSYEEWDASYSRVGLSAVETARRLIVCSYMSVGTNATGRTGMGGFRNYSRNDRIGSCPVQQWASLPNAIRHIVDRIQGRVIIEKRDAKHVMLQHDAADALHYVDPPYPKHVRGDGGDDYTHEMTDADHRELASFLSGLKGMVIVSGYDCPLYAELYGGWTQDHKAAMADGARRRTEVLWMNESAAKLRPQGVLI